MPWIDISLENGLGDLKSRETDHEFAKGSKITFDDHYSDLRHLNLWATR